MTSRHQARPQSQRRLNLVALATVPGLLYIAAHGLIAGIARPDYFLFLTGLLFISLAGIALNLGLRAES